MTDHDPLCRQTYWEGGNCFDCRLIAKVRADEQEKIARLLEVYDFIDGDKAAEIARNRDGGALRAGSA